MNKFFRFLFLLNKILLITTKTISTDNLQNALSQVNPGDIIELSSGVYDKIPYKITKSGTQDNPIIIRPQTQASIQFTGSNDACIFELNQVSYINIEGFMELSNSKCGIKISDSNNIIIKELNIHDIEQHAIVVSGDNIEIRDNNIYNCGLESKNIKQSLTYGDYQCVSSLAKNENNDFSKNIIVKNNSIENGYGEGIKFSYCDNCSAISNNITNTFSMNIYLYSSKNLLIKGNIIKVTNKEYNSKFGKAVGIGLSTDNTNDIEELEIQNNVIIGCRIGIYFFITGKGSYRYVKIYHNTLWMIEITPIWFAEPINPPSNCELFNNFIYHNKQYQLSPKKVWDIGYNIFYNTEKVPSQYEDSKSRQKTSQAIKKIDLSEIFNNINGDCDYTNANININCFRPNPSPQGKINIYHKGIKIKEKEKDLEGCDRDNIPSIGAFESPEGCKKEEPPESDTSDTTEPEPTDPTDLPDIMYDVKFIIDYNCNSPLSLKIATSLNNWNYFFSMNNEGENKWVYTLKEANNYEFNYKFIVFDNGSNIIQRWEARDYNRIFKGKNLAEFANKYDDGYYEKCKYEKKGNLITLTCSWNSF